MKKTIFAVLVVLLALLAVTCDSVVFSTTGAGPGQAAPPPEPGYVTINIGVADNSRGRAVTAATAQSQSDLFEAVFVYDLGGGNQTIARGTGTPGSGWTMTVPKVNYDYGNNKAVIFAGKSNGTSNVLLGIGTITTGANLANATGTPTIVFTVESVKSGVSKTASATGFRILTPSAHATPSTGTIPDGPGTNSAYPAFVIPTNTSFTSLTDPASITASYTFTNAHFDRAIPVSGSPLTVIQADVDTGIATTITIHNPARTDSTDTLSVNFGIATNSSVLTGAAMLSIAVPVIAIIDLQSNIAPATNPMTWVLQGGLDNSILDDGATISGGAVLVQVVALSSSSRSVSVTPASLTYAIGADGSDIELTAVAAGFTNIGAVIFSWKTTDSLPATAGDPNATTIGGVVSGSMLTIPSISSKLGTAGTFYVYCIGTEGSETAESNVVTIDVEAAGTTGINVGPNASISWP
jgi:hypothetical protein